MSPSTVLQDRSLFDSLSKYASQEGLQLNQTQGRTLPPSSLLRFLRSNPNITAAVLGDYDQGYSNRWAWQEGREGHALFNVYLRLLCARTCYRNDTAYFSRCIHNTASSPLAPLPFLSFQRFYGSRFDDIFNIVPVNGPFLQSLDVTAVGS